MLYFQSLIRDALTKHRELEEKEGRKIYPALPDGGLRTLGHCAVLTGGDGEPVRIGAAAPVRAAVTHRRVVRPRLRSGPPMEETDRHLERRVRRVSTFG